MMLNAIYEEDFLGFSYGFRPRRGAHRPLWLVGHPATVQGPGSAIPLSSDKTQ
jgi:hypothetical protein